ncbi:pilus assembly protein TadE [Oxalobacteraceae bacterium]|nr:pilus assembly protein TadE [Oxalobacteraceae bacterium]
MTGFTPPHPARRAGPRPARPSSQRGAVAITFTLMMLVMFGFIGMALDLAQLYHRKTELQDLADGAALAAARQLNGTAAGITSAAPPPSTAAADASYRYDNASVSWNAAALQFSQSATAPESDWVNASAAALTPANLFYARVDTGALDPDLGKVNTAFMGILSSALASTSTQARAIAGRSSINVLPLAICALSATPAAARVNPGPPIITELVEYGFRRGVAYDLMQLAFGSATPQNFVIDPLDPVGALGSAANMTAAEVGPFVCTGSMPLPRIAGTSITVSSPFPLAQLFDRLNSRFDQYPGNLCSPNGAPPDANIKSYVFNSGTPWMATAPSGQSATPFSSAGNLWTVADPLPAPGSNTAGSYGPLWSYARTVLFSAYSAGVAEPVSGYATLATGSWSTLYKPGLPTATAYPASTPYQSIAGTHFLAPSAAHPGVRLRRVLNVALLSCPVPTGTAVTANVLAVGRFFMTVPATASTLHAEFGGVAPERTLSNAVELYQ